MTTSRVDLCGFQYLAGTSKITCWSQWLASIMKQWPIARFRQRPLGALVSVSPWESSASVQAGFLGLPFADVVEPHNSARQRPWLFLQGSFRCALGAPCLMLAIGKVFNISAGHSACLKFYRGWSWSSLEGLGDAGGWLCCFCGLLGWMFCQSCWYFHKVLLEYFAIFFTNLVWDCSTSSNLSRYQCKGMELCYIPFQRPGSFTLVNR